MSQRGWGESGGERDKYDPEEVEVAIFICLLVLWLLSFIRHAKKNKKIYKKIIIKLGSCVV
jgi:hypothetical protein